MATAAHSDSDDMEEEGISLSEDLVASPTHMPAQTMSIAFGGLLDPPLLLHQDLSNGNGGQAWPAGMVLATYLLRSPQMRDVLKAGSMLGAGSGLVGLSVVLACRPAEVVHITDQEPMLDLMRRNVALNDLQDRALASIYDWGGNGPPCLPEYPNIVLAADCVYFEPAFPLLQQTLRDLIGPDTTCYFCFKKRRRADMHFMKAVKKEFLVEEVIDDPDRERYSRENIFLYTIRQKASR